MSNDKNEKPKQNLSQTMAVVAAVRAADPKKKDGAVLGVKDKDRPVAAPGCMRPFVK